MGGKRFGKLIEGAAATRLLETLERPVDGKELAARLGVTPQRVHQIVVKLHALGRLRIGDPAHILHVVARADDPSILLKRDEERVLSAMPDEDATTAPRLAVAGHMATSRVEASVVRLLRAGLVEKAGTSRNYTLFRITPKGSPHFQRRSAARHADPAPLKVKSDRVRRVLSYLRRRGRARVLDVQKALDVPQAPMNALMQYLKRRGLVRNVSGERRAPYELTAEGQETLAEMIRRGRR
ncbi:MAG: hypothetical protein EXQ86_11455 [Rhodospirillales bacterium]|nr:hypothetical protein [Rhodospirillales bacterium]